MHLIIEVCQEVTVQLGIIVAGLVKLSAALLDTAYT